MKSIMLLLVMVLSLILQSTFTAKGCNHRVCCPHQGYGTLQEFASEHELCWHLCITLGLARQHERLAEALAQTGINEKSQPSEYRAQAQVNPVFCNRPQMKGGRAVREGGAEATFWDIFYAADQCSGMMSRASQTLLTHLCHARCCHV